MRVFAGVLAAFVLACSGSSSVREGPLIREKVRIGVVPFGRVLEARDRPDPRDREDTLRDLFAESGCEPFEPLQAEALRTPEVVCRIPGDSDETILVTSEYGWTEGRKRDGWEAASLLPLIAESISAVPRANTVLFAVFRDSPVNLWTEGAVPRTLAMFSAKERPEIKAWVSLSASDVTVRAAWIPGSSAALVSDFLSVGRYAGAPVQVVKRGQQPDAMQPERRLLAIVGHEYDDDYLASYRTFAAYLAFIDHSIDARSRVDPEAPVAPTPL